jgi:hypothetical protein
MTGRASALAILGLAQGADSAAIEQAYKRLIKQHHPDRQGGDAIRAAEINRAYRELRGGKASVDPLQFNEEFAAYRRRRRHWPLAAAFAVLGIGAAVMVIGPSVPLGRVSATGPKLPLTHAAEAATAVRDPMSDALNLKVIDTEVQKALYLFRTRDELALAEASRDCGQDFRSKPGTAMLDKCAAFDDAVIGLQDRDPLRDGGPFAPLAVTGRQWSQASALSDDDLAIDDRLDHIRLRVELALAPQMEPEPPPSNSN